MVFFDRGISMAKEVVDKLFNAIIWPPFLARIVVICTVRTACPGFVALPLLLFDAGDWRGSSHYRKSH